MTKTKSASDLKNAIKKATPTNVIKKIKPTVSVPVLEGLPEEIETALDQMFKDYVDPDSSKEASVDSSRLKEITLRAISIATQGALLIGQEVSSARKLLSKYRTGCFNKYLETVYGNRRTPYSMMRFFEFYDSLDAVRKEKYLAIPKSVAYRVATFGESNKDRQKLFDSLPQKGTPKQLLDFIKVKSGREVFQPLGPGFDDAKTAIKILRDYLSKLDDSTRDIATGNLKIVENALKRG